MKVFSPIQIIFVVKNRFHAPHFTLKSAMTRFSSSLALTRCPGWSSHPEEAEDVGPTTSGAHPTTLLAVLLLGLSLVVHAAWATDIAGRALTVPTAERPVTVLLYAAHGETTRPAVVMLHGRQGIEPFAAAYTRYATAIAGQGIDAYLVSYYSNADDKAMHSPDRAYRKGMFDQRLQAWSQLVSEVVSFVLSRPASSGHVGLLGFSNGGYLAVASAAHDPRVAALVVLYGGVPGVVQAQITRLPLLLALHGDAARTVPLSEGQALVAVARALGAPAELVVYPSAGHGFDFDPNSAEADDTRHRVLVFLWQHLGSQ
jgi:carboxymethylenebutenolidase